MMPLPTSSTPPLQPVLCERDDLRQLLETAAALVFDVSPNAIHKRTRGAAPVALARQVAMYLAHVVTGLNYSEVARLFRRHRTTVSYAIQLVEDLRDDPEIDTRLDILEPFCAGAIHDMIVQRSVH